MRVTMARVGLVRTEHKSKHERNCNRQVSKDKRGICAVRANLQEERDHKSEPLAPKRSSVKSNRSSSSGLGNPTTSLISAPRSPMALPKKLL
eukprot:5507032-Amphidinium_carterae.1